MSVGMAVSFFAERSSDPGCVEMSAKPECLANVVPVSLLQKWIQIAGSESCWYDLHKEKQIFSKRPLDGGAVIIWRAFTEKGKVELLVLEDQQNAAN